MHETHEPKAFHTHHTYIRLELANAVTHGIGAAFFLIAVPVLICYTMLVHSTLSYTLCSGIFGFSLVITYLASTLYHSIQHTEAKRILRIFDHVSIFLLIGGSYTPVVYRYMPHNFALKFLIMLWLIIIGGMVFKVFYTGKYKLVSTLAYVALGFMVLLIIKPLTADMSPLNFALMLIGGACYTIGVPFYMAKKLRYNHALWHVFVLGGSLAHYAMIWCSAG